MKVLRFFNNEVMVIEQLPGSWVLVGHPQLEFIVGVNASAGDVERGTSGRWGKEGTDRRKCAISSGCSHISPTKGMRDRVAGVRIFRALRRGLWANAMPVVPLGRGKSWEELWEGRAVGPGEPPLRGWDHRRFDPQHPVRGWCGSPALGNHTGVAYVRMGLINW